MNNKNKLPAPTALLLGLSLITTSLQANQYEDAYSQGALTYIDASGKVHVLQDDTHDVTEDTVQNVAQNAALTAYDDVDDTHNIALAAYVDNDASNADYTAMNPAPTLNDVMTQRSDSAYEIYTPSTLPAAPTAVVQPVRSASVSSAAVLKAVEIGRLDQLGALQAQGADIFTSDAEGLTYLHHAVAAGHLKMVKYLLNNGLDPNASTTKQWTPLHHAARFGHVEIAQVLIAAGADKALTNSDGFNPSQLALKARQHVIATSLR